jgi:hypothetical protein
MSIQSVLQLWRARRWEPLLALGSVLLIVGVMHYVEGVTAPFLQKDVAHNGDRLYVVSSIEKTTGVKSGLSSEYIEALGGRAAVLRVATSPLLRFNVRSGGVQSAELVGAADAGALTALGAKVVAGSLWKSDDAGLQAVVTASFAQRISGDYRKAVGAPLVIQGRAFTISGVLAEAVAGFEDVPVLTNQIDDVESFFGNEFRIGSPAFTLIARPESVELAALQNELRAKAALMAQEQGGSFERLTLVAEPLSDVLLQRAFRVRRGLFYVLGLALVAIVASVWMAFCFRTLRTSRNNQIRLFLGLDRRQLYLELLAEQMLIGVGAGALVAGYLEMQGAPSSRLLLAVGVCLAVPVINAVVVMGFQWMLLRQRRTFAVRLEPFVACHVATTVVLWMLLGMFYQDLRAANLQSRNTPENLFSTLITMPAGSSTEATLKFAELIRERVEQQLPGIRVGYSTWLPFLDNSSSDYLRLPTQEPIRGAHDARQVEFLPCNAAFLKSFHRRWIAGSAPAENAPLKNWIVLDRRAAARHFARPELAIGQQVQLLRGPFIVVGVVDELPYRGTDLNPLPQVFLNAAVEKMLFPYLSLTLDSQPQLSQRAVTVLREEIQRANPQIAPFRIERVKETISNAVEPNRVAMQRLGVLVLIVNLALAVGVLNLARSIFEFRRSDFALMLALGASGVNLSRSAFTRLGLFCLVGAGLGVWAGIVCCAQFADQIQLNKLFVTAGAAQAMVTVLLCGGVAILIPLRGLLRAPLAPALYDQNRSQTLPWAK